VRDGYNSAILYWQANSTDASGRTTSEQHGNGVTTTSNYDSLDGLLRTRLAGSSNGVQNQSYNWDPVGNLTRRQDVATNLTELFTYDTLNRLDYSTLNGTQNLDVGYNAIGNIITKSDVASGTTWTYHATKKHAVTLAGTGGMAFTYDANGNMITRAGQATTWFSYNLPNQIKKTASTHTTFSYGASRNRYKQVSVTAAGQNMPAGTETTLYVAGIYEKVTKPSAVVEHKHTIMAGGEAIAVKTLRSNSVNDVRYLHKDHLGSVDTITNESGVVVTRLSYDAFGKRRDAGTWAGTPGTTTWNTIAPRVHVPRAPGQRRSRAHERKSLRS
jgi:YD repeat-containing protein